VRTEDGYIIHKCLNGDPAAFGLLVDKYKASIYALAYSKLRNFHDAEDVTQEAFIKAYRKLRTLRRWDSFLAWLYAITSNLCKEWIQSQSKRPDCEFAAAQDPGVLDYPSIDSYRESLARESLQEALDSLSKSYRQVLTFYYLGGMSTKEIARFLGTSPNNIAQRLRRARAKLKKEMIAVMGETYEQERLQETFTFRIVEMVKRMRTQPMPRMPWLPLALTVAAGVIFAVLSATSPLSSSDPARVGSMSRTVSIPPFNLSGSEETLPAELIFLPHKADSPIPPVHVMQRMQTVVKSDKSLIVENANNLTITENIAKVDAESIMVSDKSTSEEKQLALDILSEAWQLTEGTGYYARLSLLGEMAKADVKGAVKLAETVKDAGDRDAGFANIIRTRLKTDPESAPPLLACIQDAEMAARIAATCAKAMVQESPDKAKTLLLEAMDGLKQVTAPRSMLYISLPAISAAKYLGMKEIQQQLMEVILEAAASPDNKGALRYTAASLAKIDQSTAVSLATEIEDASDRYQAWADVITEIAESDIDAAQNELFQLQSSIEPASHIGIHIWAMAAKNVATRLAESDVVTALKLARQIPEKWGVKAIALAKVATKIAAHDRQQALDVFDEAIAAAHKIDVDAFPGMWHELARVGHMLYQIDVERGKEILSELPYSQVKQTDGGAVTYLGLSMQKFSHIAFYLADVCPDRARNIIEEIVNEANRYVVGDKKRAFMLQEAAQAATALDVYWSVQIARSIDPNGEGRRNEEAEALRKVAQYLLATPSDRQGIHFSRWGASDTWSPGDATGR